mmetsp:Transcript_16802/g.56550  ORF Transcript_16802/g.56550 Transcript_16802/m.56550 type:complete len:168 (-) Transcript_16802:488-991(-)
MPSPLTPHGSRPPFPQPSKFVDIFWYCVDGLKSKLGMADEEPTSRGWFGGGDKNDPERDLPEVPPLDEPTILLTWYDCSADEPEDYSDKLTGLDVLFTENMTAVPVIAGRTTFPLGRNLTVKVTTERQTPTAPGTKFNSGAGNFPFGVTGNLCDPTYVALPFGLGDV